MISGIDKLDSVKQAFRHWRTTRTKRGRNPNELREQVKELLVDYAPAKIGIHLIKPLKRIKSSEDMGAYPTLRIPMLMSTQYPMSLYALANPVPWLTGGNFTALPLAFLSTLKVRTWLR